jgi:CP12 domain
MKFTVVALIPAAASAFVMTPSYGRYSYQHQLRATSSTSAANEAIAAAMAASKQFGAASPEARVAWDTVEEINASDNRYGRGCPFCLQIYIFGVFSRAGLIDCWFGGSLLHNAVFECRFSPDFLFRTLNIMMMMHPQ